MKAAVIIDRVREQISRSFAKGEVLAVLIRSKTIEYEPRWLSIYENKRMHSFIRADDAKNFYAARVLTKALIKGSPLRKTEVTVDQWGKPYIAGGPAFNISHASGYVGLIVSEIGSVGIDIEPASAYHKILEILPAILHERERRYLSNNSAQLLQPESILRCWTRKEAVLKMVGTGLSVSPMKIDSCFDKPHKHSLDSLGALTQEIFSDIRELVISIAYPRQHVGVSSISIQ